MEKCSELEKVIEEKNKTIEDKETTNDESSTEASAKDSIQRSDDTRGPKPDTIRGRISGGQHGLRPIPVDTRNGVHRMEARPTRD